MPNKQFSTLTPTVYHIFSKYYVNGTRFPERKLDSMCLCVCVDHDHVSESRNQANHWQATGQWSDPKSSLLTLNGFSLQSQQHHLIAPALPKTMFVCCLKNFYSKTLFGMRSSAWADKNYSNYPLSFKQKRNLCCV